MHIILYKLLLSSPEPYVYLQVLCCHLQTHLWLSWNLHPLPLLQAGFILLLPLMVVTIFLLLIMYGDACFWFQRIVFMLVFVHLFPGRDVVPSMQNSWLTLRNTVLSLALSWRMATKMLAASSEQWTSWQTGKSNPLCCIHHIRFPCSSGGFEWFCFVLFSLLMILIWIACTEQLLTE